MRLARSFPSRQRRPARPARRRALRSAPDHNTQTQVNGRVPRLPAAPRTEDLTLTLTAGRCGPGDPHRTGSTMAWMGQCRWMVPVFSSLTRGRPESRRIAKTCAILLLLTSATLAALHHHLIITDYT